MVAAGPATTIMDVLKDGIKAVAVGVSGSKPIPGDLVVPLIQVRDVHNRAPSVDCDRNAIAQNVVPGPWLGG